MGLQEPCQYAGEPWITLDEVAGSGDDVPGRRNPSGHVVGSRLEDSAVTAGDNQSRETGVGKYPPRRIGRPGRCGGPQQRYL